ncbi:MAG: uracil-DNA glycosylase [Chloroflexota bacterium]
MLSALNGPLDALVLFVAEAPGRLGADRTGVPLSQDRSGQNFDRLLADAGLARADVFITNAVLCNPRDPGDRNRPPGPDELANCLSHLSAQVDLVSAPIVATLGVTALQALDRIEPHGVHLREQVGRALPWRHRVLIPLYHPSAQAMLHRPFELQRRDYRALAELARGLPGSTS